MEEARFIADAGRPTAARRRRTAPPRRPLMAIVTQASAVALKPSPRRSEHDALSADTARSAARYSDPGPTPSRHNPFPGAVSLIRKAAGCSRGQSSLLSPPPAVPPPWAVRYRVLEGDSTGPPSRSGKTASSAGRRACAAHRHPGITPRRLGDGVLRRGGPVRPVVVSQLWLETTLFDPVRRHRLCGMMPAITLGWHPMIWSNDR